MVAYDGIGATYRSTRRADPRIALQVDAALATMGTVVNVGAGTGSYEPAQTVAGLARLAADLRTGRWHQRHAGLIEKQQLDAGYRLLVSDCD